MTPFVRQWRYQRFVPTSSWPVPHPGQNYYKITPWIATLTGWYNARIPGCLPKSIGEGASSVFGGWPRSPENVSCSRATPRLHRCNLGVALEQETFSGLLGHPPKTLLAPSPIDLGRHPGIRAWYQAVRAAILGTFSFVIIFSTRRIGANPEESDLVNFGVRTEENLVNIVFCCFFLGETDKMLPKSRFSKTNFRPLRGIN